MSEEYEDKPSLYKALRGLISGEEFVNPYRFGETSFAQNPKRFIDRSDPSYQESIYAEPTELPSMDSGGIAGEIRGIAPGLKKIVRKAMQNEMKARGINPFKASTKTSQERLWARGNPYPELGEAHYSKYVDDILAYKEGGTSEVDALDTMLKLKAVDPEDVQAITKYRDKLASNQEFERPAVEASVTSRILRGSWYRGQSEYPSNARIDTAIDAATGVETPAFVTKQFGREYGTDAPVFAGLRTKSSNLGEPHGISLSYDPNVSTGFRAPQTISMAKQNELQDKLYDRFKYDTDKLLPVTQRISRLADTQKVARVMPLYGGPPEGKILQAWKPEHGKEFRDAYVSSAREMAENYPEFRKSVETLNPGASGEEIKNAIQKAQNTYTPKWGQYDPLVPGAGNPDLTAQAHSAKYQSSSDELNSLMSKKLMERGWKGMLHSPHRYQEYELRMFDPYDALYIDKRAINSDRYSSNPMSSKAVRRLDEMKSALKREHETVTEGKPKSLRDWYTDITREEILGLPKASNEAMNDAIASKSSGSFDFDMPDDIVPVDWNKTWKAFGKPPKKESPSVSKAYSAYKQYFGKHSTFSDFKDIWKEFISTPGTSNFSEYLKQY